MTAGGSDARARAPGATRISLGSVVVAGKDQVTTDLTGDTIILRVPSGRTYELVQVGARIWQLITEPRRVSEIRDVIVHEYDVSVERCEHDVVALMEALSEQGLVAVLPEAPRSA